MNRAIAPLRSFQSIGLTPTARRLATGGCERLPLRATVRRQLRKEQAMTETVGTTDGAGTSEEQMA